SGCGFAFMFTVPRFPPISSPDFLLMRFRFFFYNEAEGRKVIMILASSSDNGPALTINASVSGLAVYLDNWAVIDLAKGDASRRKRFVDAVCAGGDLLFSSANAAELAGPKGKSFNMVKSFLNQLGPHWVPVELNPFKVIERGW